MNRDGATIEAGRVDAAAAFKLRLELGVIRAPARWDPRVSNSDLRILHSSVVGEWDHRIDEKGYPKPSALIQPNQRLVVMLYDPVDPSSTNQYQDGLAFLAGQKALHCGIPGAALIMEQKRAELVDHQDLVMTFLDQPERLFEDGDRFRQLPCMTVGRGKFDMSLQAATEMWVPGQTLVGFLPFKRD